MNARRLRFSLRTVLLLIVLVAMSLTLWVSCRVAQENRRLREDNKRFRDEVGDLHIPPGTEDKLHVVGAKSSHRWQWKWRVYVPPKGNFWAKAQLDTVSAYPEIPKAGSRFRLLPGEHVVQFELQPDERGRWTWHLFAVGGSGVGSSALPEILSLIEANCNSPSSAVAANMTLEPGSELQLLRVRLLPQSNTVSSKEIDSAGPGAAVWIYEETPGLN